MSVRAFPQCELNLHLFTTQSRRRRQGRDLVERPLSCSAPFKKRGSRQCVEAAERWRRSPFYKMLQSGDSVFRCRLSATSKEEFSPLPDLLAAGITDYVAIITRFVTNAAWER